MARRRRRARSSSGELRDLARIERLVVVVHLQREREQQPGDGDCDDEIGQRQRLDDGVDDSPARRDVREHGRRPALLVPDGKQQHIRRRLAHAHAHDEVNQVAARDDAVEADKEDPPRKEIRKNGHLWRSRMFSSRYSLKMTRNPPDTASAEERLTMIALPPELRRPGMPSSMKFCRNESPKPSAARPSPTYAPAPNASTGSPNEVVAIRW